jgi:hypothetical protein
LDVDKNAWIFAELNQLAGTLALRDPTFAQYLPRAYDYWFQHFVDPVYGEVWNGVNGRTHARCASCRSNGNGRTRFEHALVGYIVAQQLRGELVTLFYAFPGDPPAASVQPYYFSGAMDGIDVETDHQGQQTQKITLRKVH